MSWLKLFLSLVFTFILLAPFSCFAFFPSLEQTKKDIDRSLSALRSFEAELTFPGYIGHKLHIWVQGSNWRQNWTINKNGRKLIQASALGKGMTLSAAFPSRQPFVPPLLLLWRAKASWWLAQGVDSKIKSFQFFDNRPALVIGAKSDDLKRPQYWVDNEWKVPLRMIVGEYPTFWDFCWKDMRTLGNTVLPYFCRLGLANGQELEAEINWLNIGVSIDSQVFSLAKFDASYQNARPASGNNPVLKLLSQLPWQAR